MPRCSQPVGVGFLVDGRWMETVGKINLRQVDVRWFVGGKSKPHIFPHLSTSFHYNFWSMMWNFQFLTQWKIRFDHVSLRAVPEWSQNQNVTSAWSGQRWRFSKTMSLAEWGQCPGNLRTWTVLFAFRSFQYSAWESNVVPKYHEVSLEVSEKFQDTVNSVAVVTCCNFWRLQDFCPQECVAKGSRLIIFWGLG